MTRVEHFTSSDKALTWFRRGDQDLRLADALDHTSDAKMSVGFVHHGAGESNEWIVAYDEALIVTKGRFTVHTKDGDYTAGPGEIIYLYAGTELTYHAEHEATEVVYVTYPHWLRATEQAAHAAKLDEYQPVTDNG
ncbi:AraC family ligand binding domain-containing protein [Tenggerimyces flavus]|uniref:AraC family ligand binding domain-containing protein n=1 Tax=Tenggerimyces flavus TaxID=1708749 RepID=A0ABV7YM16_9ACTN|nr:AraC family ligand binding domain-containing protein [Tenggerimyces flavus]MBM7789494.1 ethanolamine utilization protein EutQ [Tenggerimyces flavus]